MNGFSETGNADLTVSGSGVMNLSGQWLSSTTITNSGGTIANTGASGELKTSGNSLITFSGGTTTAMKVTEGGTSNIVVSGTGSLTIPTGGSMSWKSGIFEVSGATATFNTGGNVSMSNNATVNTMTVTSSGGVLINPGMYGGFQ